MSEATYVPRSPRRPTKLRAVVDDGAGRSIGRVRDMSTSGMFVATESVGALALGRKVAVVPLVGDMDGERLPAEVARVGDKGVAIRFLGLEAEHRQRLRAIMNGEESPLLPRGPTAPLPAIPDDAPVVLLTDDALANASDATPARGVAAPADAQLRAQIEELEAQVLTMIRDKSALLDENGRLKRQLMAQTARNALLMRMQDQLLEAEEKLLEVERARDQLLAEVTRLEKELIATGPLLRAPAPVA